MLKEVKHIDTTYKKRASLFPHTFLTKCTHCPLFFKSLASHTFSFFVDLLILLVLVRLFFIVHMV